MRGPRTTKPWLQWNFFKHPKAIKLFQSMCETDFALKCQWQPATTKHFRHNNDLNPILAQLTKVNKKLYTLANPGLQLHRSCFPFNFFFSLPYSLSKIHINHKSFILRNNAAHLPTFSGGPPNHCKPVSCKCKSIISWYFSSRQLHIRHRIYNIFSITVFPVTG